MEKSSASANGKVINIVLTGPECTGKSTLSEQLATRFGGISIPEYAREYVAQLGRPYRYEDLCHIADIQWNQYQDAQKKANGIMFFDTFLFITKVWFEIAFGQVPAWINIILSQNRIDHYLLCSPDIPWQPDPVRENGGEMRNTLFLRYKTELDKLNCSFSIVSGTGQQRLNCAESCVREFLRGRNYTDK
jgi:nicotinamide riboside kinase